MDNVSVAMAFAAGILAFFSPCILPLIPSYISYLTGITLGDVTGEITERKKREIKLFTALHSLCFIAGFTACFVLLGMTATALGSAIFQNQPLLKTIGALFIIFFGLVVMGVVKIPFLQREKKIRYSKRGVSLLGSVAVGATFALAWTPCVGSILGSILIYASSADSVRKGAILLTSFSLGLGIPFFISSLVINSFLTFTRKIERYMGAVKIISGVILILFGLILLFGGRI